MNSTCPVCGRPQVDGLICHHCCTILETELADVPALLDELDTTLARLGRDETDSKGGLAHERTGYHAGASIAAGALTNTLTTWARDVCGDPGTVTAYVRRNPDARTVGPYCLDCPHPSCRDMRATQVIDRPPALVAAHMLLSSVPDIRSHPAAFELHDEVVSAVRQARTAIDRAANRTIIPVGPCPEADQQGQPCPGRVFAFIPTEDNRPSRMECKTDPSHRWTSIQWLRTGKRILDVIEKRKSVA